MPRELPVDEVHLWYAHPSALTESRLLRRFEALLSDEERTRRERFRFPAGRHLFLVSRALVRSALSEYAGVAPEHWRFDVSAAGRPDVSAAHRLPWLRFNLSHSGDFVVCAVARDCALGVDVETVANPVEALEIAGRFFATDEVAELRRVSGPERTARFYRYWTLKEAYLKARGLGLTESLDAVAFTLGDGDRVERVSFGPALADDPSSWQFELWRPDPERLVTCAIRDPDRRRAVRPIEMGTGYFLSR